MVGSIPFAEYATPVLAGGMLCSGTSALDPCTGAVRWRLPEGTVPGVVADGRLYAYTQNTVFRVGCAAGHPGVEPHVAGRVWQHGGCGARRRVRW